MDSIFNPPPIEGYRDSYNKKCKSPNCGAFTLVGEVYCKRHRRRTIKDATMQKSQNYLSPYLLEGEEFLLESDPEEKRILEQMTMNRVLLHRLYTLRKERDMALIVQNETFLTERVIEITPEATREMVSKYKGLDDKIAKAEKTIRDCIVLLRTISQDTEAPEAVARKVVEFLQSPTITEDQLENL